MSEDLCVVTVDVVSTNQVECPGCKVVNAIEPCVWITIHEQHPCTCGECCAVAPKCDWRVLKEAES